MYIRLIGDFKLSVGVKVSVEFVQIILRLFPLDPECRIGFRFHSGGLQQVCGGFSNNASASVAAALLLFHLKSFFQPLFPLYYQFSHNDCLGRDSQ